MDTLLRLCKHVGSGLWVGPGEDSDTLVEVRPGLYVRVGKVTKVLGIIGGFEILFDGEVIVRVPGTPVEIVRQRKEGTSNAAA